MIISPKRNQIKGKHIEKCESKAGERGGLGGCGCVSVGVCGVLGVCGAVGLCGGGGGGLG